MTRRHRLVHVWVWFAVVAAVGCATAVWLATRSGGGP
jgi:hypothetical protein